MLGTVSLKGMHFKAFHGCLDIERQRGNEFVVDVEGKYDMDAAAKGDSLEEAVDYVEIYRIVREEMETRSMLLENVAYRIKTRIGKELPMLEQTRVRVAKMNPPLDGEVEWSEIIL